MSPRAGSWWRNPAVITPGARWSIIVLFAAMIGLTTGSYLLSVGATHRAEAASQRAIGTRATVTQLCQSGNQFRTEQVRLWEFVIHISKPPPAQRARQRRAIAAFEAYLHKIFAPRNCRTFNGR